MVMTDSKNIHVYMYLSIYKMARLCWAKESKLCSFSSLSRILMLCKITPVLPLSLHSCFCSHQAYYFGNELEFHSVLVSAMQEGIRTQAGRYLI